jgi:hypothetical protein
LGDISELEQVTRQNYDYTVYKQGSLVKSISSDSETVTSGATLEPILKSVLALGAISVYVNPGQYILPGGFSEFVIDTSNAIVEIDSNASIYVPSGYTGNLFRMTAKSTAHLTQAMLLGNGLLSEAGSKQRLWNAIMLDGTGAAASAKGISYCKVADLNVWGANRGVYVKSSTGGWVNSCVVRDLKQYDNKVFVEMDDTALGIGENQYENINCQTSSIVTNGFKNICGHGNFIMNCKVWDIYLVPAASSGNITATGQDTVIIGGFVDNQNWTDLGVRTVKLGTLGANGNVPMLNQSNIFTELQYVKKDQQDLMAIYRPNNGLGNAGRVAHRYDLMNSSNQQYAAGYTLFESVAATAGAEASWFLVYVRSAGAASNVFNIGNDGRVYCGGPNRRIVFQETGLTNFRTYNFPDANSTLIGNDATAVTLAEGKNFTLGTSTGTKWGTSALAKMGFYGKTPIVQPAANPDTSGATLANLEIEVNQLKQTLRDLGFLA